MQRSRAETPMIRNGRIEETCPSDSRDVIIMVIPSPIVLQMGFPQRFLEDVFAEAFPGRQDGELEGLERHASIAIGGGRHVFEKIRLNLRRIRLGHCFERPSKNGPTSLNKHSPSHNVRKCQLTGNQKCYASVK
jgi:hypothetical protein